MTRIVLALAGLLFAAAALAQPADPCEVADGMLQPGFPLPRVQAAIENKQLDVVVLGTASSALGGPGVSTKAYPARFESELKARLPEVAVRVTTYARPRQTAPDMAKEIDGILERDKPALLIWQTGTGDAIRAIDPESFRAALEEGVTAAHAAGSDIVLINMQYSPRTETMIALGPYLEVMRFVALQHEINLFDRFAIMKYWNEIGAFDLSAATKKTDLGERVHDCIGRLLAEFVLDSAKLTVSGDKDFH
jgi:hypothetical protein